MDETAKRRKGETAQKPVRHFRDLDVCQNALATGQRAYELSKTFPPEEKYSLTDQIRRSSRSVCANIAEAWRKWRYEAVFISKLSDAEGEAAETQVHLEFAFHHRYVSRDEFLSVDGNGLFADQSASDDSQSSESEMDKLAGDSNLAVSPTPRFAVSLSAFVSHF